MPTNIAPGVRSAERRCLHPLPLAAVAYAPPPASALPAPSPLPATASSAPAPQSSGADACAVAVAITQPDPETRLRSVAVQSVFAALPCALATPTTAAASAPAPLLPPTPAAPRQTADAHNIASAARARRYPALPPARPHALNIRPCAPTPALPLPSTFSAKTCSTRPNRSLGVSAGFCRLCPPQSPASGAGFVGYLPFHLLLLSSSIEQGELRK